MRFSHATSALLFASAFAIAPALAAEDIPQDEMKIISSVETVCGGVDMANRQDPKWREYSLRVELVGKDGQYLGDGTINVSGNNHQISVHCDGPWVLMKLPGGMYHLTTDVAEAGHKEMNVRVPAGGQQVAMMRYEHAGGEVTKEVHDQVAALP